MTRERAAYRAAASTLSRLSCLTMVNMWWRFALANSKMNFLTCAGLVRLLLMCVVCGGLFCFRVQEARLVVELPSEKVRPVIRLIPRSD